MKEGARVMGEARGLDGGAGIDDADVASDLAEEEVAEVLGVNVRAQLVEVEAALDRLETGSYGLCERCDQAIDPARLKALPWARLCLACQRHLEQLGS
jgi:DnaK suppressor protein